MSSFSLAFSLMAVTNEPLEPDTLFFCLKIDHEDKNALHTDYSS